MATVCFALAHGEQKLRQWPLHAIRAWPGSPLILPDLKSFSSATGHADGSSTMAGESKTSDNVVENKREMKR